MPTTDLEICQSPKLWANSVKFIETEIDRCTYNVDSVYFIETETAR